jgi:hypothetical protein
MNAGDRMIHAILAIGLAAVSVLIAWQHIGIVMDLFIAWWGFRLSALFFNEALGDPVSQAAALTRDEAKRA